MRIDSHLHIGLYGRDKDTLVSYLDKATLDRGWLLSWEEACPAIPDLYQHLAIEDILNATKQFPNRFTAFYAPDPTAEDFEKRWEQVIKPDNNIKGVGEVKFSLNWTDEPMNRLLDLMKRDGVKVLIFHMEESQKTIVFPQPKIARILNYGKNGQIRHYAKHFLKTKQFPGYMLDIPKLEETLQKYPEIQFVAHGPLVWKNIAKIVNSWQIHEKGGYKERGELWRLLETYPNLYCDTSGKSAWNALTRDVKKSKEFFQQFYNKILFGTDNTSYPLQQFIGDLGLSDVQRRSIMGENAMTLIQ